MKTYSSKANAKRAAKNAGLDLNATAIFEINGQWAFEIAPIAPIKSVAEIVGYNPQLLLKAPIKALKQSNVDNPVKMVWEIADKMWGERRKDIVAKCVEMGIAYNTARTQYQAFYKVKSLEAKKDAE